MGNALDIQMLDWGDNRYIVTAGKKSTEFKVSKRK
jgi:hypothetical protein